MIEFDLLYINSLHDYDQLEKDIQTLLPHAKHTTLINELKTRIGSACQMLIVEYPYRDYDFSSVYGTFYAKKHQPVSRECVRIHLFKSNEVEQKSYMGYIVVRDSPIDSRGKALLDPKVLTTSSSAFLVKSDVKAHIMGLPLHVSTVPWMAQDTDISVCAHIAVWSIVNYYAHKYPYYKTTRYRDN